MKQLFLISKCSRTSRYGVGTYVKLLVSCFNTSLWQIYVIELDAPDNEQSSSIENNIHYFKIANPIETNRRDLQAERLCNRSAYYWLSTQVTISQEVFCHFNFSDGYELAKLFKENWNATILFTLHYMEWSFRLMGNSEQLYHMLESPRNKKEKEIADSVEREKKFMQECCDRIVVVSVHSYKLLQTIYDLPTSKLYYIPHGLKDEYADMTKHEIQKLQRKYLFADSEKLILYVGRLNIDKGVYDLIHTFKDLLPDNPDLHLVIAGGGDFNQSLAAVAPYWNKITFKGYVDRQILNDLYRIADVGVLPSYHEEFGYVAVEMMMHKLLVICSNATGLVEVTDNGEYGNVFNWSYANRKHSIHKILKKWIESPEDFEIFREKGRKRYLSTYAYDRYKRKIELLYKI